MKQTEMQKRYQAFTPDERENWKEGVKARLKTKSDDHFDRAQLRKVAHQIAKEEGRTVVDVLQRLGASSYDYTPKEKKELSMKKTVNEELRGKYRSQLRQLKAKLKKTQLEIDDLELVALEELYGVAPGVVVLSKGVEYKVTDIRAAHGLGEPYLKGSKRIKAGGWSNKIYHVYGDDWELKR